MDKPRVEPELFSVPRRFDLATILVATTAAAVMFAAMSLANFSATSFGLVAGLFAIVAVGQALGQAFGTKRPRLASILAAICYWTAFGAVVTLWTERGQREPLLAILCWGVGAVVYGVITGYIVGVLVAGVFLASHRLRGVLKFA